jgi:hypothetical protein
MAGRCAPLVLNCAGQGSVRRKQECHHEVRRAPQPASLDAARRRAAAGGRHSRCKMSGRPSERTRQRTACGGRCARRVLPVRDQSVKRPRRNLHTSQRDFALAVCILAFAPHGRHTRQPHSTLPRPLPPPVGYPRHLPLAGQENLLESPALARLTTTLPHRTRRDHVVEGAAAQRRREEHRDLEGQEADQAP